jgi:hypothetical protein
VTLPARTIVVAARLPAAPKQRTSADLFAEEGDIVADCTNPGCGYHVMGPRAEVKLALKEHHRLHHADEVSTVFLNDPRR